MNGVRVWMEGSRLIQGSQPASVRIVSGPAVPEGLAGPSLRCPQAIFGDTSLYTRYSLTYPLPPVKVGAPLGGAEEDRKPGGGDGGGL